MMLVTEIKKLDSKKSLIYLDEEPAFALYRSEIRRFGIEKGNELENSMYVDILKIILKRCRERTAYILGRSDKTIHDLKVRLRQNYYPAMIIDRVIDEYETMGYLSDSRFAENYIKYNMSSKSEKRIYSVLISKGIDKAVISKSFEAYCRDDEEYRLKQENLIKKEFYKKKYDFDKKDKNNLSKIVASLLRKGFKYDEIMSVYTNMQTSSL